MKINSISINQRSACFELDAGPEFIYHAPSPYVVHLNGEEHMSGNTNVFSLFGLQPEMYYTLKLEFESGESISHSFTTSAETLFLDAAAFGCVGDGKTDCTGSLQAAINACPEGGTVYIGPGVYYSYPLIIRHNILLYLESGAVLMGGSDSSRYPILPGMVTDERLKTERSFGSWEGNPLDCYAALITVIEAEGFTLAGEGCVDGGAQHADWWSRKKERIGAWRPRSIFAVRAKELTILGISVQNSPSWSIHPYYCKGVDVLQVKIQNPPDSPNTDGCNPECSSHVRILGADISVGDDCISVKSGKYYMSVFHPAPAFDITIRNCLLRRGHGAVVVGSEIASGVQQLYVERCLMQDTDRGLRIKTRRGRGANCVVDKVQLSDIKMERVHTPFVVNMYYYCDPDGHSNYVRSKQAFAVTNATPQVRNISCKNITCTGAAHAGAFLYGLPESPIGEFRMENIDLEFNPDAEEGLPAMMDDLEPVKKLALFAANVSKLSLKNVSFKGYTGECLQTENIGLLQQDNISGEAFESEENTVVDRKIHR